MYSRRTGRPGGGEQAPRGGVPQAAGRFDLTSTGCRIAASPRERESTRSTGKRGVGEGNDYRSKKSVQTRADRTGR